MATAVNKDRRITAVFQPQAWINNYATDIDGRQEVDVTEAVLRLDLSEIHALEDDRYSTDNLVDPLALGHNGPFTVHVTDSVCAFFGVRELDEITEELHLQCRRFLRDNAEIQLASPTKEQQINPPIIMVSHGLRGHFAVMMTWNREGFYEPARSAPLSYPTRDEAISDGQRWAKGEGIEFKATGAATQAQPRQELEIEDEDRGQGR